MKQEEFSDLVAEEMLLVLLCSFAIMYLQFCSAPLYHALFFLCPYGLYLSIIQLIILIEISAKNMFLNCCKVCWCSPKAFTPGQTISGDLPLFLLRHCCIGFFIYCRLVTIIIIACIRPDYE